MLNRDSHARIHPGQRGQQVVQHLLGRRFESPASRALFDPGHAVAVVALNTIARMDGDQIAVVREPHFLR